MSVWILGRSAKEMIQSRVSQDEDLPNSKRGHRKLLVTPFAFASNDTWLAQFLHFRGNPMNAGGTASATSLRNRHDLLLSTGER
jgi:hypothetical protein